MDAIWFLVVAVTLTIIGTVVVAIRYREPRQEDSAIEAFRREMQALSPEARRTADPRLRAVPPQNDAGGE